MMRQLLDVVNQAVQVPLRVHFGLRAQGEAIEALVVPQVGEDRLHDGDAPPVEFAPPVAVDRALHALGVAQRRTLVLVEEGDLTSLRSVRIAQTLFSQMAGYAVALGALEFVMLAAMG